MQGKKVEIQIEEVCLNMERTLSILPGGGGGRDRERHLKCSKDVIKGAGLGLIGGGSAGPGVALAGAIFGGVSAYVFSGNCGRKSSNRRSER